MTCKYFGETQCDKEAQLGWNCCGKDHEFKFNGDASLMRKYQVGIIGWEYLKDGLASIWSLEKANHYAALT